MILTLIIIIIIGGENTCQTGFAVILPNISVWDYKLPPKDYFDHIFKKSIFSADGQLWLGGGQPTSLMDPVSSGSM